MGNRANKLLWDIRDSGRAIAEFISGKSEQDYVADRFLRRAVEREFEIIGEALNRMRREAPDTAKLIPNIGQVIGFRNALAHGYDTIRDPTVWEIATERLPELLRQVETLLPPDTS